MYLLDTNVVSELRRPEKANPNVIFWANSTPLQSHFISAITLLEIELGILLKVRKDAAQGKVLRRWFETRVIPSFKGRILPVDSAVAVRCAGLHVPDPRSERDALIAATALTHGMTVATQNEADFRPMGVPLVNPWKPGTSESS